MNDKMIEEVYKNYYEEEDKLYKIEKIISHKGLYLINVNSEGFTKSNTFNYELSNLAFNTIKQLADDTLISFGNKYDKPIEYTDRKIPVYPIDISTSLYIEVDNIAQIKELTQEEWRDEFDCPLKKAFNLLMEDKTIISVGLVG